MFRFLYCLREELKSKMCCIHHLAAIELGKKASGNYRKSDEEDSGFPEEQSRKIMREYKVKPEIG